MSFYRAIIAVVAAFGLATAVLAEDMNNSMTQDPSMDNAQQQAAPAQSADNQAGDATTTDQNKINLNTATAKELMTVKGLNASRAKAIVKYRSKHGEFKSLDELKQVKGFHKMKGKALKGLQDQLSI